MVVVTATPGEHGTSDPIAWPPQKLARHRRRELQSALAAVGVHELTILGFEDGRLEFEDGTALIAQAIADVQPEVIVTFGPDGMTNHPDHRAISRLDHRRLARDRRRGRALVRHPHARVPRAVGLARRPGGPLGRPARAALHRHGRPPPHRAPQRPRLDTKIASLRAHRSQTEPLEELVGASTYREWWSSEAFVAAPRESASQLVGAGYGRA